MDAAARWSRFSNLAGTSYRRHIQTLHEHGDLRNPDILAGVFMTPEERDECLRLPAADLAHMRSSPYYHYLTARTKYYDQVLLDAVAGGIRRILLLGAGHDTRLYRFGGHLAAVGADVAECDQPEAIAIKRTLASPLPHAQRVAYFGVDLNETSGCLELGRWLRDSTRPALVCAEGVSPYVETAAFHSFLRAAGELLPPGSILAYDFKYSGAADDFGRRDGVGSPFRLPADEAHVVSLHLQAGFTSVTLTTCQTLMQTFLPSWHPGLSPLFTEDAIIHATRT